MLQVRIIVRMHLVFGGTHTPDASYMYGWCGLCACIQYSQWHRCGFCSKGNALILLIRLIRSPWAASGWFGLVLRN